jgi:uncharacterized protein YjbI with pentapeptide repeats
MHALVQVVFAGVLLSIASGSAATQDMMRHIDLTSPEMTSAETTRAEIDAMIVAATPGRPLDLTGKKLSGLDLSGLDLSKVILRAAQQGEACPC